LAKVKSGIWKCGIYYVSIICFSKCYWCNSTSCQGRLFCYFHKGKGMLRAYSKIAEADGAKKTTPLHRFFPIAGELSN
jgi:hypothetical protein